MLTACSTTHAPVAQDHPLLIARTLPAPMVSFVSDSGVTHSVTALESAPLQDSTLPDVSNLARTALTQLGIKYRYGGKTPDTGFDCSGLVVYAAEQSLGLKLPHHAATLARLGVAVKRKDLREGDLVFFNTRGRKFSHMGIYLGENQFVHAPRTGAVVRVERMDTAYWQKRYNGARRLDTETLAALSASRTS